MVNYCIAYKFASIGRGYIVAASERAEITAIFAFIEHIRANRCYGRAVDLIANYISCRRGRR